MQVLEETWKLYFNGASNQIDYGIGVLLIASNKSHVPLAFRLRFEVSNNQAEYKPCIAGFEAALEVAARRFENITFTHMLRKNNRFVDALATLAYVVDNLESIKMKPIIIEKKYMSAYELIAIIEEVQDRHPWYYDIWNFIENKDYSHGATEKHRRAIRYLATQYIPCGGRLYKRGHLGMPKSYV
ncbi:uncharacterized protein LOC114309980 [Camellia sinensis]|uniref:uncharacterized protein LOC114309980 n=1 Tax=Camellia sinensis TaxID=4442 RepID=UPI001036A22D|nr:uncharacterized protein LOC114309980 [Camellia sinensis]